jgi:beta-xylosidase
MKLLVALLFTIFYDYSAQAQQLILPGANPDPSVVKIGDTYWASATSSNWFPAFPLLYSKDLVNWKQKGYVFNTIPEWADYYFWAPEISYDSGRVYIYYTAHKRNGNLCVGVASADRPEGPYKDHGPLVCQPAGSIDAFPMRDTTGKLYLIWKEDANSVNRPTPIWASEMNEERTALIGEKTELFRNDAEWEKELVEGVSMIKNGEYFYAFYAAAGCCGSRCTYVSGVARAKSVLGPWEKYIGNPILTDTGDWLCRGHGTAIEKDGRFYFLYHGFDKVTSAFTGREGLLQEFRFTANGWIEFINVPLDSIERKEIIRDDFNSNKLEETWQWSVFKEPKHELKNGQLQLFALPAASGRYLGQRISSADYTATTAVDAENSTAFAGIGAIGTDENMLALLLKNNQLTVSKVKDGIDSVFSTLRIPVTQKVYLQMRVKGSYRVTFLYSLNGKNFIPVNKTPLIGAYLPPWDNPPRAGLISKGAVQEKAIFEGFELRAGTLNSSDLSGAVIGENRWEGILYLLAAVSFTWLMIFGYKKIVEKA